MYKIILNGREIETDFQQLSYKHIASLAYGARYNPDTVYTMTYSYGKNHNGSMIEGDIVTFQQGLIINVGLTNNA